jgi:pyridoxamine 5'-phosphate oxidase
MSKPSKPLGELGRGETLPDHLPRSPLALFRAWFDEAQARNLQPNPNAMTLASVDPDGRPSARIVLCKGIEAEYLVFYTNYEGRKGRALAANPRAAVVFHWDQFDRQVRSEGPVTRSPGEESDAYFHSRRWESRLGAWASDQSEPIASREALISKVKRTADELGVDMAAAVGGQPVEIDRPPHWGGFRLWFERVELWCGGVGRVHDRAAWSRPLRSTGYGYEGGGWTGTRLQP